MNLCSAENCLLYPISRYNWIKFSAYSSEISQSVGYDSWGVLNLTYGVGCYRKEEHLLHEKSQVSYLQQTKIILN